MKRLICILIVLSMVIPVFANRPYTEKEVTDILEDLIEAEEQGKFFKEKLLECAGTNLELNLKLSEEKELNKAASKVAKYILGGFGVWGILEFSATGGVYSLVTGGLFLWGAIK